VNIQLERESGSPLYQQIIAQVTAWIASGDLPPGAPLPSIRQLARELGIGQITVRQAYDELLGSGLLISRKGSGTFVADRPAGQPLSLEREESEYAGGAVPPMVWQPYKFNSDFFGMPRYKGAKGALIDLSRGQPDPALFPFERIKQVVRDMLWDPKEFFFERGHAQGYQPLVEWLEHEMALSGVDMRPGVNEIIVTGGFQRGLSLVLDLLAAQQDGVVIEEPTFPGIINLLIAKGIRFHTVPMDSAGLDTEHLAQLLRKERVKAIITIPTYHNPTGTVLSNERRQHLISLAVKHRVPVIEDDWSRPLRYTGSALPPLKALDTGGYVIQLGTFSKTFLPGLRIGWITVPGEIAVTLLRAKLAADHGDSWFLQVLLHECIKKGHYDKHLRKSLKVYKQRRAALLAALRTYMPSGVSWIEPGGGLNVWVRLPQQIMSAPLLRLCREEGLDFGPAPPFMPSRQDAPALRLSFSKHDPAEIETGVKVLGSVLADVLAHPEKLAQLSAGYKDFL
jgi:DNA-binding transcriptional MocR family regulator